jgi:hypothetical protein
LFAFVVEKAEWTSSPFFFRVRETKCLIANKFRLDVSSRAVILQKSNIAEEN